MSDNKSTLERKMQNNKNKLSVGDFMQMNMEKERVQ